MVFINRTRVLVSIVKFKASWRNSKKGLLFSRKGTVTQIEKAQIYDRFRASLVGVS